MFDNRYELDLHIIPNFSLYKLKKNIAQTEHYKGLFLETLLNIKHNISLYFINNMNLRSKLILPSRIKKTEVKKT